MSITKARKIQLGRESTAGTAVASTTVWGGPATDITDERERVMVDENIGMYGQTDRGYFPTVGAILEFPETEMTFEQCLHPFEAGIRTDTPAANGGTTSAYIYEYLFPYTSANTLKYYTLEAGNDQEQYEQEYSFVESISITGAPREAVKYSHRWRGRQKTACDFTAGQTRPTVEEILFSKGKLYLDASGGTLGATLKAGTWMGMSMDIDTGWRAKWSADGQLYFYAPKNVGPAISGKLTLEYDTVGEAIEDVFVAGTTYLMRQDFPGAALSGTGGTHSTKLFRFDSAIQIVTVDNLASVDGNDQITFNWVSVWGNAGQTSPQITVVNLLAAVP